MKKLLLFLLFISSFQLLNAQSPPLNMTLLAQWDADTLPTAGSREYNDIWGWVDCSGNEYAIIGSAAYVHFFDVTDPSNINELAYFEGGQVTTWRDMKTYEDRAYAVSENTNEGLMIFDLSNIQDTIIKTYHSNAFFNRAHNIYIDNDNGRLYAVGTNTQGSGVIIFDIDTDPDNPVIIGSVDLPGGGYIHDIYVKDNIGYASHGYNGFYIWDFTDASNPVYMADIPTNGYNHSSWLTPDGQHILFAEEVPLGLPLGILDVSDAINGNISLVGTFKFPLLAPDHENNVPHNPFIRGNYAFVSHYHDGLQVFDISDVNNPQQVAYYDSHANDSYSGYSGNWGTYPFLPSGNILASDINEGLLVLSADSLTLAPSPAKSFPDATLVNSTPNPFCEGDAGILEVPDGAEHYTWYKDNEVIAFDQNFVIPNETGEYYCEVSNGHCAVNSEAVQITINSSPDLSTIEGGNFMLCPNDVFTFVAPTGYDSYTWLQNGNILSEDGNTLIIFEQGDYNVIVSQGPCSELSETVSITYSPGPQASFTNSSFEFCEGDELVLELPAGNDSIQWFQNGNYITTTTDSSFTITEGGTYSVSAFLNGCIENSPVLISISPSPLPDASLTLIGSPVSQDDDSALICQGSTIDLETPFFAGYTYQWFNNQNPVGSNNNTLTVSDPGNYTVLITSDVGCINESINFTIAQSLSDAEIEFDGGILSEITGGTSYQWYLNGAPIQGADQANFTPLENGDYHCEVINSDGCVAVSNSITVVINSTFDIEELEYFHLFPNPTNGSTILSLELKERTDLTISILHTDGRVLSQSHQNAAGSLKIPLDFSNYAAAVYFIKIETPTGQVVRKVVKY